VSALTPGQRTLRASIAANARWAREDGKDQARRGQRGLRQKFEREIREEFPNLDQAEVERRADHALRAHMQRLALKSSKARSRS
jgi:hypothetical protein